jgi:hypothetical protein
MRVEDGRNHTRSSTLRCGVPSSWQRPRCILKVDVRNAFKTYSRSDFLHVGREQFPELFNYAAAAYGHESFLQFADAFLASRAGVHQGDPLGPLFFALALVVILKSIDTDALELNAWYRVWC